MKDDAQDVAGGKRRPLKPINLREPRPPDETGFLIVRLKRGRTINRDSDLATAAEEAGLIGVSETLTRFSLTAHSLIDSDTAEKLRTLEQNASDKRFAPKHSLSDYWRVDVRKTPERVDEIEEALRRLSDVDLVYREKTVSDPVAANDDVFSGLEKFLDPAPVGVDARWVWTQLHGDGSGMHFIDLEQGWGLHHEDLPGPTLIFNHNRPGSSLNHGTSVLGIVAGVDNALGVIGIAPKVASVRAVSHWNKDYPHQQYIAQALAAAALAQPPPHVILIEVQIGTPELPVETDSATLIAIQLAAANGIIVIEAAGNGDQDLDTHLTEDSGAILVGAGERASTPQGLHNRSIWDQGQGSNFGSRVTCYAWGDSIVSAGYGDLPPGFGNTSYTQSFGGTSGAAAIIAGCALLLQGIHVAAQGSPMSPDDMRNLLSNPATGTAQGTAVSGNIGVMPNLRAIVENLM
jgi:serine protease